MGNQVGFVWSDYLTPHNGGSPAFVNRRFVLEPAVPHDGLIGKVFETGLGADAAIER